MFATLSSRFSADPDDILQDALVLAWRTRAQFDPALGSPRNWLLAITELGRAYGTALADTPTDLSALGEVTDFRLR